MDEISYAHSKSEEHFYSPAGHYTDTSLRSSEASRTLGCHVPQLFLFLAHTVTYTLISTYTRSELCLETLHLARIRWYGVCSMRASSQKRWSSVAAGAMSRLSPTVRDCVCTREIWQCRSRTRRKVFLYEKCAFRAVSCGLFFVNEGIREGVALRMYICPGFHDFGPFLV